MQTCQQSAPSNFTLVYGPWGECSSSCNCSSPCTPSNRARQVTCQSALGYLASLDLCNASLESLINSTITSCTDQPACLAAYWSYTPWVCNTAASEYPTMACVKYIQECTRQCMSGLDVTSVSVHVQPSSWCRHECR